MTRFDSRRLAAVALAAAAPWIATGAQALTYGTNTQTLLRGSAPGDFPGFYGGTLGGAFPVALTEAQARAAVLGAPDNVFLSLPGVGSGTPGTAFGGAYVEINFGANFGPFTELSIWELGDNQEAAQIFLWSNNGGNVQFTFTRGANDLTVFDLSIYAGTLAAIGGTAFTKVGIGGLDENGASKGFDLDAVAITPVPEPSTYALMLGGLGVMGFLLRRRRQT